MLSSISINHDTLNILRELSQQEKLPLQIVLEKAIENYRRQSLLQKANQAYANLRNDPLAWDEEMKERTCWEVTLKDGLEED